MTESLNFKMENRNYELFGSGFLFGSDGLPKIFLTAQTVGLLIDGQITLFTPEGKLGHNVNVSDQS